MTDAPKTKALNLTEGQLANLRWLVHNEMDNFGHGSDTDFYKSMSEVLANIDELMREFN